MQSFSQIITTNKPTTPALQLFTCRMPFLSPNQQCLSTDGKSITCSRQAYLGSSSYFVFSG